MQHKGVRLIGSRPFFLITWKQGNHLLALMLVGTIQSIDLLKIIVQAFYFHGFFFFLCTTYKV